MKNLDKPDSFYLEAAQGWLELGNHVEANEELENIAPDLRAHPSVLLLRCEIYMRAEQWKAVATIAETLVKVLPDEASCWIHRSFALHALNRTQEAFDLLLPAAENFPKVWTIPYNLACYCSQLGRFEESENWLKKAMVIDEHPVKRAAIDDPDMQPLWDSMSGTLWKRAD